MKGTFAVDIRYELLDAILEAAPSLLNDTDGAEMFTFYQMPDEVFQNAKNDYGFVLSEPDVVCIISLSSEKPGSDGIVFTTRQIWASNLIDGEKYGYHCPYENWNELDDLYKNGSVNIICLRKLRRKLYGIIKTDLDDSDDENNDNKLDLLFYYDNDPDVFDMLADAKEKYSEYPFGVFAAKHIKDLLPHMIMCLEKIDDFEKTPDDEKIKKDAACQMAIFWNVIETLGACYLSKSSKSAEGFYDYYFWMKFWGQLLCDQEEFKNSFFDSEIIIAIRDAVLKIALETDLMLETLEEHTMNFCEKLDEVMGKIYSYVKKIYAISCDSDLKENEFQVIAHEYVKEASEYVCSLLKDVYYEVINQLKIISN